MHVVPWRPEESIGAPVARVTGNCEPLGLDAGKQTPILRKSS